MEQWWLGEEWTESQDGIRPKSETLISSGSTAPLDITALAMSHHGFLPCAHGIRVWRKKARSISKDPQLVSAALRHTSLPVAGFLNCAWLVWGLCGKARTIRVSIANVTIVGRSKGLFRSGSGCLLRNADFSGICYVVLITKPSYLA